MDPALAASLWWLFAVLVDLAIKITAPAASGNAAVLIDDCQSYRDLGRELTLDGWRREPLRATFLDGVARLTSALD